MVCEGSAADADDDENMCNSIIQSKTEPTKLFALLQLLSLASLRLAGWARI